MNYPIPLPMPLVLQAIQQAANNLTRTKKITEREASTRLRLPVILYLYKSMCIDDYLFSIVSGGHTPQLSAAMRL